MKGQDKRAGLKGFTLLEVMVAAVIVGILASTLGSFSVANARANRRAEIQLQAGLIANEWIGTLAKGLSRANFPSSATYKTDTSNKAVDFTTTYKAEVKNGTEAGIEGNVSYKYVLLTVETVSDEFPQVGSEFKTILKY